MNDPRKLAARVLGGAILLAGLACVADVEAAAAQDSEELRAIYEADQADRSFTSPPTAEEWAEVSERDGRRRARVLQLLRADSLRTGGDLYHAAMILQHGEGSEDILLAHILATAAAFAGDERGRWLSAASLDRYLLRTESPQRLGTQYQRASPSEPWGQEPYESWLPDTIRDVFGVIPLDQQAERVRQMNRVSGG